MYTWILVFIVENNYLNTTHAITHASTVECLKERASIYKLKSFKREINAGDSTTRRELFKPHNLKLLVYYCF